jgi:hypothetical protein
MSPIVAQLRDELSRKTDGWPHVAIDLPQLRKRVGRLVLHALNNEDHPLAEQLRQLTTIIEAHRAAPSSQPAATSDSDARKTPETLKMSNEFLFMPHPGISLPIQQFWPLQLLLFETACSAHQEALASRLKMTFPEMKGHVLQAYELSVSRWSEPQHLQFLCQALLHLEYPEPPIRLDGQILIYRAEKIELSKQQTESVRLLIENMGKAVTHEQFHKRGIKNPVKILYTLKKKARKQRVSLPIYSGAGTYTLTDGC